MYQLGTVKQFDNRKGYGFITGDDGGSYFFHRTKFAGYPQSPQTVSQGQRVQFSLEPSNLKPGQVQAVDVMVIDE